jgi:hypothetical protein
MSSSPSIKSSMNSAASRRTFFRWRELGRAPQCVKLPQRRTAHLAQRAARLAAPPPRTHRVTTTTDVRFWGVRRKRSRNVLAYEVRWVVAGKQRSRSRRTRELAESFLADLRQAARRGEAFDLTTGLPLSVIQTKGPTWLEFAQRYIDMKWPRAATKTRDSLTDALSD